MNLDQITFGIEIETTIPTGAPVTVGHYHSGRSIEAAPAFNGAKWNAQHDGSILTSAGRRDCEFVSPILSGEAGIAHLVQFVEWLNSIGAQVNNSCGLHIHVGLRGLTSVPNYPRFLNILARLVSRHATALYAQTGTLSREQGHYCAPPSQQYRQAVNRASRAKNCNTLQMSRYQLLNLTNIHSRGTVEFRCFASTTNIAKILLHLHSVLLLCVEAAQSKWLGDWDKNAAPLTGVESLKRLFRKRSALRSFESATLNLFRDACFDVGQRMAQKYDEAKAARQAMLNASNPLAAAYAQTTAARA